ncbi:MAG: hypothetical protein LUC88_10330 [Prevotella sp.]|nr:hypothetical protein [Prevotella sp.]
MEEIHTKLLLKSCEGYGVQSGSNLILIQEESFVLKMNQTTVYLLDKRGHIVCTIVNNQLEYESEDNQDRRYQNNRNGFVVEWSNEGTVCTITCSARRSMYVFANAFFTFCDRCGYCARIFVYKMKTFFEYLSSGFRKRKENTGNVKKLETNYEMYSLYNNTKKFKQKLQANTCDMDVLREVAVWWAQLNDEEIKAVKPFYNFSQAIAMYRLFFLAKKCEDMGRLQICKNIFSNRQLNVIREYGKSEKRFKEWKFKMGMSFTKPYENMYLF